MPKPTLIAILVLLIVFGVRVPSAEASTFTVSRFDDPPPSGCVTNDCSLREAIIAANTVAGADTVKLPAGTYTLSIDGAGENAAATGDLDITDSLTLSGESDTVIDGGGLDRLFQVGPASGQDISVELTGLSLQGGHAVFTRGIESGSGGAIYIKERVNLTLTRVKVSDSWADLRGGGIYSNAGSVISGSVNLFDSSVIQNRAGTPSLGTGGGGIWNDGDMTLDHVTVTHNAVGFLPYGGITNQGHLTIVNSSVASNTAGSSAGIGNGGTLTIADSSVTANVSTTSGGGISGGGEAITINGSTIANNRAGQEGGGIQFQGDSGVLLRIEDSVINNNLAGTQGGGIYNWFGGDVLLRNVTVSDNYAVESGDGLYLASGSATIINSTFAINTNVKKPSSAIVNANGAIIIRNSIVAYTFGGPNCVGTIDSLGYNIDDHESCNFNGPGDLSDTDPRLDSLEDNGGPTLTHALRPGSPAIDAAEDVACTEADQRGSPRHDGNGDGDARCDIGAYEFDGLSIPTATATPSPTPVVTPTASPAAVAGDANCDGRVTNLDAALILQRVAGLIGKLPCAARADANGDGQTNAVDALLVLQITAALF